jgi:ribonuclease D
LRDSAKYATLRGIFSDPSVVKILHGGDTDITLLQTDLEIALVNVFDTARAYQYLERLPN